MVYTKEHMARMGVEPDFCDTKTRKNAIKVIQTTPFAKHRLRFMELLPHDGFGGNLNVDTWHEIFAQIKKESDKDVKKYMLGRVLNLFFASGWGWFMRSGDFLSGRVRETWQISDERRAGAVSVLKMLKKALYDTRQWTRWSNFIDQTMREYGSKEKPLPKNVKFAKATRGVINKKRSMLHRLFGHSATK